MGGARRKIIPIDEYLRRKDLTPPSPISDAEFQTTVDRLLAATPRDPALNRLSTEDLLKSLEQHVAQLGRQRKCRR